MRKLILIAGSTLALCACQPFLQTALNSTSICQVGTATLIDDKAVFEAESLYNIPAHAYKTSDEAHLITPAIREVVRPKLLKMFQLLEAVRHAKGAVNCDISDMKALSSDVTALIPSH